MFLKAKTFRGCLQGIANDICFKTYWKIPYQSRYGIFFSFNLNANQAAIEFSLHKRFQSIRFTPAWVSQMTRDLLPLTNLQWEPFCEWRTNPFRLRTLTQSRNFKPSCFIFFISCFDEFKEISTIEINFPFPSQHPYYLIFLK